MDITNEINKTIDLTNGNLSFDELKSAFWNNSKRIKKLNKADPLRDELLDQNDIILEKVHQYNQDLIQ